MINTTTITVPNKHQAVINKLTECRQGYKLILSDAYRRRTGISEVIRTNKKRMLETIREIHNTN